MWLMETTFGFKKNDYYLLIITHQCNLIIYSFKSLCVVVQEDNVGVSSWNMKG